MNQTHPKRIAIQERRKQALELRRSGLSLRDIGAQLGVSAKQIQRDLLATLEGMNDENAHTAAIDRAIEIERLDTMFSRIWPLAAPAEDQTPDLKAVDRVIKIIDQRARLLGLYAPIKQEHAGKDGGAIVILRTGMSLDDI
jgi:orotate phosphoribosyltransferase-like protein